MVVACWSSALRADANSPAADRVADNAGPMYRVKATVADDVAAAMIRYALEHEQDVVQRVTHGETGMIHRLLGDVAQEVVRSGAVPVLLVHPNTTRRAEKE